jgi:branched-chain amino acid transport system substrate-binding protein
VRAMAPLRPDVVFFGGEYEVGAAFSRQVAGGGVAAPVMGGDGLKDDKYVASAGAASEGDLASTVGAPLASLPAAQAFTAAYARAGFAEPPSDFGAYAYDAAQVLIAAAARALRGAGGVTARVRADTVAAVQATDITGVTGRVTFDAFGDTRTKVLTVYRVSDGAWRAVRTETIS